MARPIKAALALVSFVLAVTTAGAAFAQAASFTRISQAGGLAQRDFALAYGVELKRSLTEFTKSNGGGGGGGLGGRADYSGVHHRISFGAGLTDWLAIGIDQTLKQPAADDIDYGVLAIEARFDLTRLSTSLARALPVRLITFGQGRIRVNARRKSSLVFGAGFERQLGKLWLAGQAGFETTAHDERRENGMRYQVGASYALLRYLQLTLEAWGAMVWPEYAVFQQDHHGGPSVRFVWGRFYGGIQAGFGIKERPNRVFVDLATMARLGLRI